MSSYQSKRCEYCGASFVSRWARFCSVSCQTSNRYRERYRDPMALIRAFSQVDANGCWIWQRYIGNHGYGTITFQRKRLLAHRVAYENSKGQIQTGFDVDHLCRNRKCVNPDHLEAVTHKENVRRGASGPRTHCKRGHPFTAENVRYHANGDRQCRVCLIEAKRAARAARCSRDCAAAYALQREASDDDLNIYSVSTAGDPRR